MAAIAHLCTACKHPDFWRGDVTSCPNCSCRTCTPGPPELRPTYDLAGQRVERITQPGQRIGDGRNDLKTCACAKCKALYKEPTAA